MTMLFSGFGGKSFGSPMPSLQLEGGAGYGEHPVKFIVSLGGGKVAAGGGGKLMLFAASGGQLKPLDTLELPGEGACGGGWSPEGRLLAVCLEQSGGLVLVKVGERSFERLTAIYAGPEGGRPGPRFRSAVFAPGGGTLYAAHTALDRLYIFSVSPEGKILSDRYIQLPEGDGIRQLLLRPDMGRMYASAEQVNAVMAFSLQSGEPVLMGKIPSLTPEYAMPSHQGSLCMDKSGAHLYVSNRGANTVTVFRTGADSPTGLERVTEAPVCGDYPRQALLTPDGRQMVCCNQRSNSITVLPVGEDGVPGLPQRVIPFMRPSDVTFLED